MTGPLERAEARNAGEPTDDAARFGTGLPGPAVVGGLSAYRGEAPSRERGRPWFVTEDGAHVDEYGQSGPAPGDDALAATWDAMPMQASVAWIGLDLQGAARAQAASGRVAEARAVPEPALREESAPAPVSFGRPEQHQCPQPATRQFPAALGELDQNALALWFQLTPAEQLRSTMRPEQSLARLARIEGKSSR